MVNIKIGPIIFFAAKDGDTLYSHQKQDQDLPMARSWTPYCKIQTEIEESEENHYTIQVKVKMKSLNRVKLFVTRGL